MTSSTCVASDSVAPGPADRGIEAVAIERPLERLGFHDAGVQRRAGIDRIDVLGHAFFVDIDDEIKPEALRGRVAERDHVPELPPGVDMQQREWRLCREE